jgi:hypothetical protein|tara:strand:+ start:242 stop:553 length:312 start_codon:yes stop_codon:yes gene_type:complete
MLENPRFVRGSLFLDVELQWIHHTTWHTTSTAGHAVVNIMTNITISVSMLMYIDVLGTMLLQSTLCSLFLLTPAGRHTPTQYEGNFNEFVQIAIIIPEVVPKK